MGNELQTLNTQNKLALWAGRISECRSSVLRESLFLFNATNLLIYRSENYL